MMTWLQGKGVTGAPKCYKLGYRSTVVLQRWLQGPKVLQRGYRGPKVIRRELENPKVLQSGVTVAPGCYRGSYRGSYRGTNVFQRVLQGPQGVREGITGAPNAESRGTHWIIRGSSALSFFPCFTKCTVSALSVAVLRGR